MFQNVHWSGIAVQFSGQREAHPPPGSQVRDLLFGERLDGTRLKSSIGLVVLHVLCRRACPANAIVIKAAIRSFIRYPPCELPNLARLRPQDDRRNRGDKCSR